MRYLLHVTSIVFMTILLVCIVNAETVTYTGKELFNHPDVTFPTTQPTLNGDSLVFGPGDVIFGKLLVLPLIPAGTFSKCSSLTVAILMNLTRLPCVGSFGCAGGSEDWDPKILLGDGINLIGGGTDDDSGGYGAGWHYLDIGNAGSEVSQNIIFTDAGYPEIGDSVDVDVILTLEETDTTVQVSFLEGAGSYTFSTGLDCTAELSLVFLRENELGEQYQINSVTIVTITDLLYTPVTPCRIADTRKTSAGIIGANTDRDFHVFGNSGTISAQGGNSSGCPSPLGQPLAAHINMVAVDPTGKGNLKAFPVGAGTGAGLSVNYNTIDTNLANAGTVKTVTGSGPDITVASNFSSAHVTMQVLGYYYPDGDFLYTPVKPCKIVDTRNTSAGMISANTQRDFYVFGGGGTIGAQGGNTAGCLQPLGAPLGGPEAAHINMVAVNPTGKGNLKAFPKGVGATTGLSVNYNSIDTNLANAGTVMSTAGAGTDITVASNFSSAHVTIQVLGYYYPNGDLMYTPVIPCKIVDTRNTSAGIVDAGTQRCFHVFGGGGIIGPQGGNPAGCPSPLGEPLAAHINMVAVNPTGKGNLKAFPEGVGATTGLSVNYNTIDTNLANAGTIKTIVGVGTEICVASSFSSAHVTVQVLGYYYTVP